MIAIEAIEFMGDWVKGPFANATIDGFIIRETEDTYGILVKSIQCHYGEVPTSLTIGSLQIIPKIVIDEFYTRMDVWQQKSLLYLTCQLDQKEWTMEVVEQFHNPFATVPLDGNLTEDEFHVYMLNSIQSLGEGQKDQLFYFIKKMSEHLANAETRVESIAMLEFVLYSLLEEGVKLA